MWQLLVHFSDYIMIALAALTPISIPVVIVISAWQLAIKRNLNILFHIKILCIPVALLIGTVSIFMGRSIVSTFFSDSSVLEAQGSYEREVEDTDLLLGKTHESKSAPGPSAK